MACYTPLYAYKKDDGELSFNCTDVDLFKFDKKTGEYQTPIPIPCGQCIGCRLDYSRQWADRCMLEAKNWKHNYFVTLTLDDNNLVIGDKGYPTLKMKDMTDFLKRLRRHYEYTYQHTGIRYLGCGEYGTTTARPHYHLLLFNCPIKDLKKYSQSEYGILYNSDTFTKIWKKGHVVIGAVSWRTAAYVARYNLKKQKMQIKEWYEEKGMEPETIRMSRCPGIGGYYYEMHKETIYETDEIFIPGKDGQTERRTPPKYFDKLYNKDNPKHMQKIKVKRAYNAELKQDKLLDEVKLNLSDWTANRNAYLEQRHESAKQTVKKLKRK